jgi:hypothetical protein
MKTAASTLVAKGLLVEDKGCYVTLALPANPNLLTWQLNRVLLLKKTCILEA